ncbi:di-heme oxidoredictase family protein [Thalassomonas haliotis]|uniref:glucan endo-1,3-beta-D-glucosidase n=1 Tax=Thalassomonas haliotis TaxID=485448 RepID=A0ABY7V8D0_9GAMM|nr:di-heme oxidoredictase family protein [Thalassomonas haliotis]WDE09838.1 thrombospondin type 3 repeat-containing protein [Thalassomonas haliotis]
MKLICPGWSATLLTLTTLISNVQAADWPTEQIGAGAVSLEAVGEQVFDWQGPFARSSRTTPANPYLTANFTGPIPTNDWASSLIMDPFSKSLYAHPLSFKASNEGLEISLPPLSIGSVDNMGETSVRRMHDGNVDLVVKPSTFAPTDARADKITDWSYDLVMANGDKAMKATIAHGLPYAFFEFTDSEPVISLKRGTSMNVVSNNGHQLHIRIWDPLANRYNHYGLFAPLATSWTISATQISANLPDGKNYFTVAGLPDDSNATFLAFADKAYNFVTDTRVNWSVSDNTGQVSTQYQVTTSAKSEGNNSGTLMALYPHQWRNLSGTTTGAQYESIRGIMKLVAGNSFTTVMDYHGILPRMPDLPDAAAVAEIGQHLSDYYGYGASLTPKFIQPGADGGNTGYDTYWMGKNFNRLSGLIGIADMLDNSDSEVAPMTTDMLDSLKGQLEYWFDGNKPTPDNYFYYNQDYGTLIGYPASYGSDNDLNDHHFHYGYWINAAAQVALRDPTWAQDENWGGMVKELINDIAGDDRNSSRYPFLRNFDIYEGHSWASGTVPHNPDGVWAGGNNNEASSEGINAWAGLILWGEATGDKSIRDLGIYLYTHEVEAANSYWFNLYGDIGHQDYPNIEASRVWGGGYDHSTWWTEDPIQTHAINFLPITAASMYLGENQNFVQQNFDAIWREYQLWDGDGGQFNKEQFKDRWQDLLSEYLAFSDADAALARWKSTNLSDDPVNGIDPALGIEFGESRAHTYHHIKTLQLLGQPDFSIRPVGHSLGLVFNKNGVKTYVAYNATASDKTLLFSDGMGLVVPAGTMNQGPGTVIADTDNDGVADPLDLCPDTPANSQVDNKGCPLTPTDSDNDGVRDSLDLCPGTPANTQVDNNGCPIVVQAFGIEQNSAGTVTFYVNTSDWAIVHYRVNNNGQQNVTMVSAPAAGDIKVYTLEGLNQGDSIDYWFTYNTPTGAVDTPPQPTYLVSANPDDPNSPNNPTPDSDGDGIPDNQDLCADTPQGTEVDNNGCAIAAPVNQEITSINTLLVGGPDSPAPGFALYSFDHDENGQSNCFDACAQTWPPLLVTDGVASGVNDLGTVEREAGVFQLTYQGKPLYFYSGDTLAGQTKGRGQNNLWWTIPYGQALGDIMPLYDETTPLEAAITFDRGDALITRISDRARDRHAKENHFQAYDHFLSFYWEERTAAIEIIDYVAKGGSGIEMKVKTLNKLDEQQAENRWWYIGNNTLAEYCGNGVMASHDNRNYVKASSWNCRENRDIQIGDKLEFEISQFLDASTLARGRSNYYGTTYLYIVGTGIVPWDVTDKGPFVGGNLFQRDSIPVPESARAGGDTSLHVQMTAEPDGHFQQMATNLSYDNGQPWVLGRRVHHSSFVDGSHDENDENGIFAEVSNLAGSHYISERCTSCHVRNGRAVPAGPGVPLDKWVFKVGDGNGNPHPNLGRVLQGQARGNASSEGLPVITSWTEANGLRSPNYQFSGISPQQFSARITPQLNGLGLLEAIPESSILALADEDDSNGDGISGKVAKVPDPISGETRLGRFGYKGASASIKHQVSAALNSDMGVMTSVLPVPDCGIEQNDCATGGQLADEHLDNLVKYISLLGVRAQRDYNDTEVLRGKQLFKNSGCNACHVESFQTSEFHPLAELRSQTIYPYTDLLLHDMGPGLADNLGEGEASGSEWRTAPLWGLGLSACVTGGVTGEPGGVAFGLDGNETCTPAHGYLHDGRARSIDEAIRWHGGESEAAALAYQNLSADDRAALLKFVGSL